VSVPAAASDLTLTRACGQALRTLLSLAGQKSETSVPSHQIAAALDIPERFLLNKVLAPLVTAGVLKSTIGPHGGYQLIRPLSKITLLEVVEAVDGPLCAQVPSVNGIDTQPLDDRLEAICGKVANRVRRRWQKIRLSQLADPSK
jgi:Rrf2 family protein